MNPDDVTRPGTQDASPPKVPARYAHSPRRRVKVDRPPVGFRDWSSTSTDDDGGLSPQRRTKSLEVRPTQPTSLSGDLPPIYRGNDQMQHAQTAQSDRADVATSSICLSPSQSRFFSVHKLRTGVNSDHGFPTSSTTSSLRSTPMSDVSRGPVDNAARQPYGSTDMRTQDIDGRAWCPTPQGGRTGIPTQTRNADDGRSTMEIDVRQTMVDCIVDGVRRALMEQVGSQIPRSLTEYGRQELVDTAYSNGYAGVRTVITGTFAGDNTGLCEVNLGASHRSTWRPVVKHEDTVTYEVSLVMTMVCAKVNLAASRRSTRRLVVKHEDTVIKWEDALVCAKVNLAASHRSTRRPVVKHEDTVIKYQVVTIGVRVYM